MLQSLVFYLLLQFLLEMAIKNLLHIYLQKALHKPVAFIILPIFALANTAIIIGSDWHHALSQNYTLGIALGLIFGKPWNLLLAFLP
jgi:Na+/H+ antiporter NhaA